MQQPLPNGVPRLTAPTFYMIGRQPLRPGAILLAMVAAFGALFAVLYGLGHTGHGGRAQDSPGASRSPAGGPNGAAPPEDDKDDDPNQIDTIVLGDPADAPVPGKKGDHVSPVHATIIVRLPRFGEQVGLIPDSGAGRLLYKWLAAFNKSSDTALGDALPNVATGPATEVQMELRRETGGFNLLSAREVEPGVLVFRLRDQSPEANEVLGTLQMRAGSDPPAVASFSLRAVPRVRKDAAASPVPAASPTAAAKQ